MTYLEIMESIERGEVSAMELYLHYRNMSGIYEKLKGSSDFTHSVRQEMAKRGDILHGYKLATQERVTTILADVTRI